MPTVLAINGGYPVRKRPFSSWPVYDERDERALLDVLRSGKWTRHQGQRVEAFEKAFAAYQGARFGIAVMNGSVALRVALQAAGVGAGDEVIVPPYTFLSTASAVLEVNAVPVFVDIEPDTYCLDPGHIEAAITPQTRAILPVHFAGQAAAMDQILDIARRYDLLVLEDAAHAHGAEYKGQRLGSLGQMGCFSFQASKNLTAGEGGIILTSDERYERLSRALHTCGRFPESAWYEHHLPGGNYRMSEFQGALLLSQLERLEEQAQGREWNGRYLNRELSGIPGIRPLVRGNGETRHAYHLYIFRYDPEAFGGPSRTRFLEALNAEGIPCSAGYPTPLYRQPLFTGRSFDSIGDLSIPGRTPDYSGVYCPVSERACQEACWIAQPILLGTSSDMDDIVAAVRKIYEHRDELLEIQS